MYTEVFSFPTRIHESVKAGQHIIALWISQVPFSTILPIYGTQAMEKEVTVFVTIKKQIQKL